VDLRLLGKVLDRSAVSGGVVESLVTLGGGEGADQVGSARNAHQYREVRDGCFWPFWPLAAGWAGFGHGLIVRGVDTRWPVTGPIDPHGVTDSGRWHQVW
jgi:hypothetical protein